MKDYKMTNQRTRTTPNSYLTTSYTHNIYKTKHFKPDLIRAVGYTLNTQENSLKTSHIVAKDKSKSSNANTPPMATYKQLSTTFMTSMNRSD